MVQENYAVFDDEAFARAFEEASRAEMGNREELHQQQDFELGQDIMINESAARMMESDSSLELERLGADLIHDPSREDLQDRHQQDDPDALARTAAQLLDSVKDNRSDKFQNSQFLELMRQLRDREVTVQGDTIVGMDKEENQAIKVPAP